MNSTPYSCTFDLKPGLNGIISSLKDKFKHIQGLFIKSRIHNNICDIQILSQNARHIRISFFHQSGAGPHRQTNVIKISWQTRRRKQILLLLKSYPYNFNCVVVPRRSRRHHRRKGLPVNSVQTAICNVHARFSYHFTVVNRRQSRVVVLFWQSEN